MTSGWAAGMQSISVRSARGAIAAALCCTVLECLLTALAVPRSTGDDAFSERCASLSRRWRKRLSACALASSPHCLLCCLSKWSLGLDALFDRAFRSAQTTTLRMEKAPKEHLQKPDQDRRQLGIKVLDRVLNHRSLPNRRVTVVSVTHACATQKLSSSRAAVAELG